jgi:DNA-directed RNA polymerase subunit H (RpoH/RPB5)
MELQGYDVSAYDNFRIGEINLLNQRNELDMIINKPNPRANEDGQPNVLKMYIHYAINASLPTTVLTNMIDNLFNNEEILTPADTLFIVSKNSINKSNMSALIQAWEQYGIFVVVQGIRGLQFNILKHVTVPPHRIMSKDETDALLKRYTMTLKDSPEISRFDPVAQIIGLRPGSMCEMIRSSKASIKSLYYRVCTNTDIK